MGWIRVHAYPSHIRQVLLSAHTFTLRNGCCMIKAKVPSRYAYDNGMCILMKSKSRHPQLGMAGATQMI